MLSTLRDIALKIAPELQASPLYFIPHPSSLPEPESVLAYAVTGTCHLLDEHIRSIGIWQGAGEIVSFVKTGLSREKMLAVAIHETAHILPHRKQETSLANESEIALETSAFTQWAEEQPYVTSEEPNWMIGNHGKEFIRVLLHLWWRAALIEEFVNFNLLYDGSKYDVSPIIFYFQSLGNEPVRMKDATFAEILATEPPTQFNDLWSGDLSRWMVSHPNEVKAIKERNNDLLS